MIPTAGMADETVRVIVGGLDSLSYWIGLTRMVIIIHQSYGWY